MEAFGSCGRMRRWVVVAVVLAGCGGSDPPQAARTPAPTETAAEATAAPQRADAGPRPRLRGAEPCPDVQDATCSTLRVPLDRSGSSDETLDLRVAVAGAKDAPVLVMLTGGPGEPALPFMDRAREWFGPEAEKLRLVAIDQRGTGARRAEVPGAAERDGRVRPDAAARRGGAATARRPIGDQRAFFTTADTVADLDALRRALGRAPDRARRHLVRHLRRAALRTRASGQREPTGARLGRPGGRRQPAVGRPDQGGRARAG